MTEQAAVSYFESRNEALAEVQRRNRDMRKGGYITTMGSSGYGGFKVTSMPADILIDQVADGIAISPFFPKKP